ncbi:hypothetical protein [Actinomadura rubrisoli]|uniref:Uncharacterized protein n=1 Tax=Actinomadura rubrisoli TaxID=2530368 RepID=A0A4R5B3X2_9ACTN|nr:hypothetical protein [Actinomadura rubrisoli]TDD79915.1 hypothetical protein E1298_26860 [Actinomadura rubrisoli]
MNRLEHTVVDLSPVRDAPPSIPAGITTWWGEATQMWWALLPSRYGPRLVEAPSAEALAVTVDWYLRRAAI